MNVQGDEATQWKNSMVFREPPIPKGVTVTADTSNYYPTLQQLHNLQQLAMAQSRLDRNEEIAVNALLLELSGGLEPGKKRQYGLTDPDALADIHVLYHRNQVCQCHQHTSTQHGPAKPTCSKGPNCLPFTAIVSVCCVFFACFFFCMALNFSHHERLTLFCTRIRMWMVIVRFHRARTSAIL